MSLAAVIITFNEQKNIKDALDSAKKITDEIIVIDSGSTDDTVKIAETNGARVIYRAWDDDFSAQRNFAAQNAKAKWLFQLDADERISDELAASIKQAVQHDNDKIYVCRRKNTVFGQEFGYGVFRPDKVERLYPRDKASWQGKVHEGLKSELPREFIKGTLVHYPYDNWEQYFNKFNKYTTIWAQDAFERGKKTSLPNAFIHAGFSFLKVTFIDKGILDGWKGLMMCCFHFVYTMTKYVKLYDLWQENGGAGN